MLIIEKQDYSEKLDRYKEALAVWNQIIPLETGTTDAYFPKVRLLLRFGHYKEAITTLEQIIHIDTRSDNAYFMKGKTLELLKGNVLRYEDSPGVLEAFYNRLFLKKQYRDVLKAYDQAIHLSPENSYYDICKGNVLKHLGRIREAINTYEKGIDLEETEKLKETKEFEKEIQPGNSGNRRNLVASRSTKRDNRWFTKNKSIAKKHSALVYLLRLNPLLIPVILGGVLNSLPVFLIALLCLILLTILFVRFAKSLYARLDAATWLIPATAAGIGWACVLLLTIPASWAVAKLILIIISLLAGFLGNAFIYLFLEIHMGILDRLGTKTILTPSSAPPQSNKTSSPHAT